MSQEDLDTGDTPIERVQLEAKPDTSLQPLRATHACRCQALFRDESVRSYVSEIIITHDARALDHATLRSLPTEAASPRVNSNGGREISLVLPTNGETMQEYNEKALHLEGNLSELRSKHPKAFKNLIDQGCITVDTWDKITNIYDMCIENIIDMIENEKTVE